MASEQYILAVLLISALSALSGCTSPSDAMRALDAEGMTEITITGYDYFACAEDDFYRTGFIATSREGKRISGTVCSGFLFKNATVRF
jgi:hypothetical protein